MDRAHDRPVRGRLILVTGGARSGKSTYGERLAMQTAEPLGGGVVYLATSETNDEEMAARVAAHQAARPGSWTTVECPLDVAAAVREYAGPVFLLDCVTFWVTNLLFRDGAFGGSTPPEEGYNYARDLLPPAEERAAGERVRAAVDELLDALDESGATLVAVSNEVGLGVVPEYPLARLYRDQLGWANQRLAAAAEHVYFLVAGQPLDVKALAADPLAGASPLSDPPRVPKEPQ